MNEEFVYISDPKDVSVLVRNEGEAPIRPHLDAIVEGRVQQNLPVGITALQGIHFEHIFCSTIFSWLEYL